MNASRVPLTEVVYGNEVTWNGQRQMWRPQHRNVTLVKGAVRKFLKPCQLVVDTFARMLQSAESYLFLHNRRRAVGCEKDSVSGHMSMPSFVESFFCQQLNYRSYLTGEDQLNYSACEYWLRWNVEGWGNHWFPGVHHLVSCLYRLQGACGVIPVHSASAVLHGLFSLPIAVCPLVASLER